MKTVITAALLSLGSALAQAQEATRLTPVSELHVGYVHETFKMRDLQASPMLYVANLNGVRLGYVRNTPRNQWRVGVQAGLAHLIAPGLGIRGVKFVPEQEQPLWLVPTLYRAQLDLEYRRLIGQTARRTTWLGLGLRETLAYADGLVLSTWAYSSADLRLLFQTRIKLRQRHTLVADAALPVLAAISRLPYSNVVSKPNESEVAAFFGYTRPATLNRYLSPKVGVSYRFELSPRMALAAAYRYNWLRYTEPRLIRTADYSATASVVYKFQFQHQR